MSTPTEKDSVLFLLAVSFVSSGGTPHSNPVLHIQEKLRRLFEEHGDLVKVLIEEIT